MNILKNMEVVFIVAVAAVTCISAFAKAPAAHSAHAPTIANSTKMITVVVTGKRLSAAEKAQLAAL